MTPSPSLLHDPAAAVYQFLLSHRPGGDSTPGPWLYEPSLDPRADGFIREATEHGYPIARVSTSFRTVREYRANARLAAAAPVLLAAAKAARKYMGRRPKELTHAAHVSAAMLIDVLELVLDLAEEGAADEARNAATALADADEARNS